MTDLERLCQHIRALETANEKLEMAVGVLRSGMGGHGHWDPKGTSGSNCQQCELQRDARAAADKLCAEARALLAGEGEED